MTDDGRKTEKPRTVPDGLRNRILERAAAEVTRGGRLTAGDMREMEVPEELMAEALLIAGNQMLAQALEASGAALETLEAARHEAAEKERGKEAHRTAKNETHGTDGSGGGGEVS